MNKNILDEFIADYMYRDYEDIATSAISRNFHLEDKIMVASKIDYILHTHIHHNSQDLFSGFSQYIHKNNKLATFASFYNKKVEFLSENDVHFKVKTPFLRCYAEMRSIPYDQAIVDLTPETVKFDKKLSEIKKNTEDTLIAKKAQYQNQLEKLKQQKNTCPEKYTLRGEIELINRSIISRKDLFKHNEYQFFFAYFHIYTENCYQSKINFGYFPEYKVLLPSFESVWYPSDGIWTFSNEYFFNPYYHNAPLFNLYHLNNYYSSKTIVILTDSIEIAQKNQNMLSKKGHRGIIWVSWYGEQSTIDQVDWEPLKNKTIYYLLKEHSGMDGERACAVALAVRKHLAYPDYRPFKYISILKNPYADYLPLQFNNVVIWDQKNLKDFTEGKLRPPFSKSGSSDSLILHRPVYEIGKNKTIFSPFIHSRSVALIYGSYSAKTWIAINIALAVKYGAKMWEGCEAKKTGNVLYVHGCANNDFLTERKQSLEKQYNQKQKKGFLEFHYLPEDENGGIFNDLELVVQKLGKLGDNQPILIILDQLPYLEEMKNKRGNKIELNCWLRKLKSLNYSILIINGMLDEKWSGYNQWKKDLAIDAEVKVEKQDPICAEGIAASVSLRSGSRDRNSTKFQHVELDPTAKIPRWEIITTARTKEANKKRINKLLLEYELTDQKIAQCLNLSLDQVKKFKQELREEHKEFILNDNKNGVPESKISKKYGIAPQIVSSILRKRKNKNPYS